MSTKKLDDYSSRHRNRLLEAMVEKDLENVSSRELELLEMEVEMEVEINELSSEYKRGDKEKSQSETFDSMSSEERASIDWKADMETRSQIMYEKMLKSLGVSKEDVEDIDFEGEDYDYSDSECGDSDTENNEFNLADSLREVCRNLKRDDVNLLLQILRKAGLQNLPKNANSLLNTPKSTVIEPCEEGEYFHYGLSNALQTLRDRKVQLPRRITIDFGIDGVPLSKSGKRKAWPIIARIRELPSLAPFLIGCYHGVQNPTSPDTFLRPLTNEFKKYENQALQLPNQEKYYVKIGNFICDTPARCLVTATSFYNAKVGCGKCEIVGEWKKKTLFLEKNAPFRTNKSFRDRRQRAHHKGKSPLEDLDIDMIKQFPLDYMHLVCLGIMKLLLEIWFRSKKPLLSPHNLKLMSEELIQLGNFLPKEFNRKTHSMTELGRWKATVLRTFLLYLGFIVLRGHIEKKFINNFTMLSCAIRILCHPTECIINNSTAKNLLAQFLGGFKELYGQNYMTFNPHNLTHLADECIIQNGPLDAFSAFEFENYMQFLKKLIRKHEKPLQQIHRRLAEGHHPVKKQRFSPDGTFPYLKFPSQRIQLPSGCTSPHKSLIFKNFELTVSEPNNCCILRTGLILYITGFGKRHHNTVIIGRKFLKTSALKDYPIEDSRDIGIYIASNLSDKEAEYTAGDIAEKACLLIHKNIFYVVSLIHH